MTAQGEQSEQEQGEQQSQSQGTEDSAGTRVVENAERSRFELLSGEELLSLADYRIEDGAVVIPHVETPTRYRGQGHAGRLMAGVLEILEATDRKLVPLCPYAAQYVDKRPEHHHLVAQSR